jgi:hypothetical protein
MAKESTAIMKRVIDECKKYNDNLPEEPKNLLDPFVIAARPGKMELHLAKRDSQIIVVSTDNGIISQLILLDDSALVGIIGWTIQVWQRLVERLPIFREYIDSEGKNQEKVEQGSILLEEAFLKAESEAELKNSLLPSEEELQKARMEEYKHGALGQINWDSSAWKLKRAADNLLRIYLAARSAADSHRGPRIFVEGGRGWEEHFDEQLIGIYYMLMGLAIENLFKGIIMVNHPEYLTQDGLEKINKHETYEFLVDPALRDLLKEFDKFKGILAELAEYVKWKAKYPVSESYKEFEPIGEFIDRDSLIQLYESLNKRARKERRLQIIRKHGKAPISIQEFMDVRKEILVFMNASKKIKDISEAYPQWDEMIILHVLEDIAEDLDDKSKEKDLRQKIELFKLGHDV